MFRFLNLDYKMNGNDNHSTRRHMTTLFEFARAMRTSIQNINENSYNNFITRIGMYSVQCTAHTLPLFK